MKKLLLSLSLVLALGSTQAQNIANFNFNSTTAAMTADGWFFTNQSSPVYVGAPTWSIAAYTPKVVSTTAPVVQANPFGAVVYTNGQTSPAPLGQDGVANQFAIVNYTSTGTSSTAGSGTISNWMITPVINVKDGDVVSFYTRLGRPSSTTTAAFADNLELRMSTNGDFTTNPTGGATGLGDFTELLVAINPSLNLTSYPTSWTKYSYVIDQVGDVETPVKFAFRYFVTNGGPAGANSDIIGVDTGSVDRPLATDSFFRGNFSVSPNPATDVININKIKNAAITAAQITDINGRIVKTVNGEVAQINIADLTAGVYMLKITTAQGSGTTKIIKK